MNIQFKELYNIYLNPSDYVAVVNDGSEVIHLGSCSFRNDSFREYFEFRFNRSDGSLLSMIIPLSDSFNLYFKGVYDEISRVNTSLFGEYSYSEQRICRRHSISDDLCLQQGDLMVNMAIHIFTAATPFVEYVNDSSLSCVELGSIYDKIARLNSYLSHRFVELGSHSEHDYVVGGDGLIYICNATSVELSFNPNNTVYVERLINCVEYIRGVDAPKSFKEYSEYECGYTHNVKLYGDHLECGVFFQCRARIRHNSGYGFIDSENRVVVEPIYDWCSNYREGRSVVSIGDRWGMIDLYGHYIIEPEHDEVILFDSCSVAAVRRGEEWAYYSYVGRQCTPFAVRTLDYNIDDYDLFRLDDYIVDSSI